MTSLIPEPEPHISEEAKLQERVKSSPLHQELYKYIFRLDYSHKGEADAINKSRS